MRWIDPVGVPQHLAAIGYTTANWDLPQFISYGLMSVSDRHPTAVFDPIGESIPLRRGAQLDLNSTMVVDPLSGLEVDLETLISRRLFGSGFIVMRDGLVRSEWYGNGLEPSTTHILQSVTKTLTAMMVGIAVDEGKLAPNDLVRLHVPTLVHNVWDEVTLQHVLDMSVGIFTEEDYAKPTGQYREYVNAVGYYGKLDGIGAEQFLVQHLDSTASTPGEVFNYASCLTNILALALESAYGRPAVELYEEYLYRRVGAEFPAEFNCDTQRVPLVDGHLNLTLRDFARWASLHLNDGRNLDGDQVVPEAWVRESTVASPELLAAFAHSKESQDMPGGAYHNKTWLIDPEAGIYWMLGIHGQYAMFDKPRSLMVCGVSAYPVAEDALLMKLLMTILTSIQAATE